VSRALESIPAGARALVVDAESTDDTVARAKACGAQVTVRPWPGFVSARLGALELVRTEWTFMLDADEALDRAARDALAAVEPETGVAGFTVARTTFFCGRPMRHGPWGTDAPLRCFRTARATLVARPAAGGAAELHERWTVAGRVLPLAGTLAHHSYPTLASYCAKFGRYTALEAGGVRGSFAAFARALGTGLLRVPWYLGPKGGFRDGWQGAFVSVASALYPVVVRWKALRRP
jgi:glycosyltransferase involved in cell wall biosynthesis